MNKEQLRRAYVLIDAAALLVVGHYKIWDAVDKARSSILWELSDNGNLPVLDPTNEALELFKERVVI